MTTSGGLDVLLVAPVETGSGETVTVLHMAQDLEAHGHRVRFLASTFAASFLEPRFSGRVRHLTDSLEVNLRTWVEETTTLPDAIVFSDYSLFAFPTGTVPLTGSPQWEEILGATDAVLITLDHFGFSQREMVLFPGPPHLGIHTLRIPALPDRFRIMLPCPMHEPGPVDGRRGEPFRYWQFPLGVSDDVRGRVRAEIGLTDDTLLVVHSVPRWASSGARELGLGGFYRELPVFLDHYLGGCGKPVTLISINDGGLLEPPVGHTVEMRNLSSIPVERFEELLFSADLVLTENKLSISLGKAICAGRASAVLRNGKGLVDAYDSLDGPLRQSLMRMERTRGGTVFRYEVFPAGMTDLDELILYRGNRLTDAFVDLEVFGGDETRRQVCELLVDEERRGELESRQRAYAQAVSDLDSAAVVLERVTTADRGSA